MMGKCGYWGKPITKKWLIVCHHGLKLSPLQEVTSFFQGGRGAFETSCPLFRKSKKTGRSHEKRTKRHIPAQTVTNWHKPAQTGTNRHEPAHIFVLAQIMRWEAQLPPFCCLLSTPVGRIRALSWTGGGPWHVHQMVTRGAGDVR